MLGGGGHGGMRRMQSLPQLVKSGRGPNLPRRAWDLENTTGSPTKKKECRDSMMAGMAGMMRVDMGYIGVVKSGKRPGGRKKHEDDTDTGCV